MMRPAVAAGQGVELAEAIRSDLEAELDFMGNRLASYFSQLFENERPLAVNVEPPVEKSKCKKCKKGEEPKAKKKERKVDPLAGMVSSLPHVEIPCNPSPFAVFAAIRATCLENRLKKAALLQLRSASIWKESEENNGQAEDPNEEATVDPNAPSSSSSAKRLPKMVGIGLQGVFEIIRESRTSSPQICRKALLSLMNILQGLQPEELAQEPPFVMDSAFLTLLDIATSVEPVPGTSKSSEALTLAHNDVESMSSLASACLLSFVTAFGNTGKLLVAISSLLMQSQWGLERIVMPSILVSLQKSVVSVMLNNTNHPHFAVRGVPEKCLTASFPVDFCQEGLPTEIFSMASDGTYLYLQTSSGLLKVGSGYAGTARGRVYQQNQEFFTCPGWLGHVSGQLFFSPTTDDAGAAAAAAATVEDVEVFQIDPNTLSVMQSVIIWDQKGKVAPGSEKLGQPRLMFSDESKIGVIFNKSLDNFSIKFLDPKKNFTSGKEMQFTLAQRSLDIYGISIFNESGPKHRLTVCTDKEVSSLQMGKEFAMLLFDDGKLLYSGKLCVLGRNQSNQTPGKWNQMVLSKSHRIIQTAVGHEGQHALLLTDDGVLYFLGDAKRGEDGEQPKVKKQQKPSKIRKFNCMDGVKVAGIAANNGTSVLVSKEGDIYMYGKDTAHCDYPSGLVTGLKGTGITRVVIGKAHVVALSKTGDVYTFGVNNKGQCGRDFPSSKEGAATASNVASAFNQIGSSCSAMVEGAEAVDDTNSDADLDQDDPGILCAPGTHTWRHNQCMICSVCGECTGYGSSCVSAGRPERNLGNGCGCGVGDSGCEVCGCCRSCAGEGEGPAGDAPGIFPGFGDLPHFRDIFRLHLLQPGPQQEIHKLPAAQHPAYREKFNRRRLQKLGSGRRWRRYAEKDKDEFVVAKKAGGPKDVSAAADSVKNPSENEPSAPAAAQPIGASPSTATSDVEKESGKLASLPPAKVAVAGGLKIVDLSAGLHHTLLLTDQGQVYAFGGNSHGQLGTGDLIPRGAPSLIPLPAKATQVAAGSYHSIVLLSTGEVYTFGSSSKHQLGRSSPSSLETVHKAETSKEMAARELWFAFPGAMTGVGMKHGRSATWIGASGDQSFVCVNESLVSAECLFSGSAIADKRCVMVLPTMKNEEDAASEVRRRLSNDEGTEFKGLIISKQDGSCKSLTESNQQTNFSDCVVTLDPHYNVLWVFSRQKNRIDCYNPLNLNLTFAHVAEECAGEYCLTPSVVSSEIALPLISGCEVHRSQAALNMLGCLDTLAILREMNNLETFDQDKVKNDSGGKGIGQAKMFTREDFNAVNRFESHGGGWGYSNHSVEAIRVMSDKDVLLGGFGLFGGRGEYIGKIKLFDIGPDGERSEIEGELVAESEEVTYKCGARQTFPIFFDEPFLMCAGRWFVAWAHVEGPSSDCGSSGQAVVNTEDEVQFIFNSSKNSNNGTDVNAGQIPQLYYKLAATEDGNAMAPGTSGNQENFEADLEPIAILSPRFSKCVSVECFQALTTMIHWSWTTAKSVIECLTGSRELLGRSHTPTLSELERLVYIYRASLRLCVTYVEEAYPNRITTQSLGAVKRKLCVSDETQNLAECVYKVRSLLQQILTDPLFVRRPDHTLEAKAHHHLKSCRTILSAIMNDSHRAFVSCFYAFYPTGYLKWICVCSFLAELDSNSSMTEDGCKNRTSPRGHTLSPQVNYDRLLKAVLDALCDPLIKLRNTFPLTYNNPEPEVKGRNLSPSEKPSMTSSMTQAGDGTMSPRFPVLSELMLSKTLLRGDNNRGVGEFSAFNDSWTFKDVLERLLIVASSPVSQALLGKSVTFSDGLVVKSCQVISSVVSELANQSFFQDNDIQNLRGHVLLMTPNRFGRSSNEKRWNTSSGSPDAICFSVDKPGIHIVGCCVYGGFTSISYELELLDDLTSNEKDEPALPDAALPNNQRWSSMEIISGAYSAEDCIGDIAEIKFNKSVAIKPHIKYALQLRNVGGLTNNGDNGTSVVKGPDGTTFSFSSCPLSLNGTNPTRGQIPQILYYCSTQEADVQSSTKSLAELRARQSVISMTGDVVKSVCKLMSLAKRLCDGSNGDEDDRVLNVLNSAPIISQLMPHVLASVSPIISKDPKCSVQVLSLIQDLLPSVSALVAKRLAAGCGQSISDPEISGGDRDTLKDCDRTSPTSEIKPMQHFSWVESEHPYRPGSFNPYSVKFPPGVGWMSLEFDPRCCTAQPEDVLQIYIKNPVGPANRRDHCPMSREFPRLNVSPVTDSVTAASPDFVSATSNHFKHTPVLHKFSGTTGWPVRSVILPGNEVLFSLETASDYMKDDKDQRFGFRCLVVGYETGDKRLDGLNSLEMELSYLGGVCAASLMKEDIPLSSQTGQNHVVDVLGNEEQGLEMELIEESALDSFDRHSQLLKRGFALDRLPSVEEALDGTIPFCYNSNERQFLRNFVQSTPNTRGGRLARWLQPEPFVDVGQCQLHFPEEKMRCHWPTTITVETYDQYGDMVQAANLKVEVKAAPLDQGNKMSTSTAKKISDADPKTYGGQPPPNLFQKYEVTVKDKMFYHAITMQKCYDGYSFEELRFASPALKRQYENMLVRSNNDGTYSASWTPGNAGFYQIFVTIDGCELSRRFKVEVKEAPKGVSPPTSGKGFDALKSRKSPPQGIKSKPSIYKFVSKFSSGLRIRVHPSLQSEQVGVVPLNGEVTVIDGARNSDGLWVRLGQDSLHKYASVTSTEGWCLEFNNHLDQVFLVSQVEEGPCNNPSESAEFVTAKSSGRSPKIFQQLPELAFASELAETISSKLRCADEKSNRQGAEQSLNETSCKWKEFAKCVGPYTVIKCGASGHNIRSHPNLSAAAIGILNIGDKFNVSGTLKGTEGELWVQLDKEAVNQHCFNTDGDAWSLAVSSCQMQYLQSEAERESRQQDAVSVAEGNSFISKPKVGAGRESKKGQHMGGDEAPDTSKERSLVINSEGLSSAFAKRSHSSSPSSATPAAFSSSSIDSGKKPSFFSKWFKTEAGPLGVCSPSMKRGSSASPPLLRKSIDHHLNKDIPPELQGVSVKELVKVIGESRVNGNGVTPPESPAMTRRSLSVSSNPVPALVVQTQQHRQAPVTTGSPSVEDDSGVKGAAAGVSLSDETDTNTFKQPHTPAGLLRSSSMVVVKRVEGCWTNGSTTTVGNDLKQKRLEAVMESGDQQSASDKTLRSNHHPQIYSTANSSSKFSRKENAVKEAISPSMAESIRAVFAAFVWHEGIVHDAMALASYLKFHPDLTKRGEVMRMSSTTASNTAAAAAPQTTSSGSNVRRGRALAQQRHSVGVFSTSYLHHQAKLLLGSSQLNANILQRDGGGPSGVSAAGKSIAKASPNSDLPPTIWFMAHLWEEVQSYCIHTMLHQAVTMEQDNNRAIALEASKKDKEQVKGFKDRSSKGRSKNKKRHISTYEEGCIKFLEDAVGRRLGDDVGASSKPLGRKKMSPSPPGPVHLCELCDSYFPYPLTRHMRVHHPGCKGPARGKGYNNSGRYCGGLVGNCGDMGIGHPSGYHVLCEKCRTKYLKGAVNGSRNSGGGNSGDIEISSEDGLAKDPSTVIYQQQSQQHHQYDLVMNNKVNEEHRPNSFKGNSIVSGHSPLLPCDFSAFLFSKASTPTGMSGFQGHAILRNNAMFLLDLSSSAGNDFKLPRHDGVATASATVVTPAATSTTTKPSSSNPLLLPLAESATDTPLKQNPFPVENGFRCFGQRMTKIDEKRSCLVEDDDGSKLGDEAIHLRHPGISPPEQFQTSSEESTSSSPKKLLLGRSISTSGELGGSYRSSSCGRKRNSSFSSEAAYGYRGGQYLPSNPDGILAEGVIDQDLANPEILSRPSQALVRLFTPPRGSLADSSGLIIPDILQRPVMNFVLQWNDLESLRASMIFALRKAACKNYAMQAFNWLTRTVSQPRCLHDILWCFAAALEKPFAKGVANLGSTRAGSQPQQQQQRPPSSKVKDDVKVPPRIDENFANRGEDNEEDILRNLDGGELFDHPLSDIQLAGDSVEPLTQTFHSLLQTISELLLLMPVGSTIQEVAISCLGIKFRPSDHNFLHSSHIFSTISQVLSRNEEVADGGAGADGAATTHKDPEPECQRQDGVCVEKWTDLTNLMDIEASSRPAMIASLTDNSTETFWESGEEDKNKVKWVKAALPANRSGEMSFSVVAVHVDNVRDIGYKVSSLIFKCGADPGDDATGVQVQESKVESRFSGWVTCFINDPSARFVKIVMKVMDRSVRLRQIKVLGTVSKAEAKKSQLLSRAGLDMQNTMIQRRNCETETLRVFRLLTSQVFGRLLQNVNDADEQQAAATMTVSNQQHESMVGGVEDGFPQQPTIGRKASSSQCPSDSAAVEKIHCDLKEHVVGILFSRPSLSHLQKQVCSHIVSAIKAESAKLLEDSDSDTTAEPNWSPMAAKDGKAHHHPSDTYCFEMMSLVSALSGSLVGRKHLASQHGLIVDLVNLLHFGSGRVQRQAILLLRRILPEITPAEFANIFGVQTLPPNSPLRTGSIAAKSGLGVLDMFLSCISKSLTVQVKVKGSTTLGVALSSSSADPKRKAGGGVSSVTMDSVKVAVDLPESAAAGGIVWQSNWLRGRIAKNVGEEIISLLKDMSGNKLGEAWAAVSKGAIAENILNLTQLEEPLRQPTECLKRPAIWLALASLCALDKDHAAALSTSIEWPRGAAGGILPNEVLLVNAGGATDCEAAGRAQNPRPTCENHDDGETPAMVVCNACGNLCFECDRFLHLSRKAKSHNRQVFKEEEEAIKVDLHEGCGRAKLFWVMALADSHTLKAMVEFRSGVAVGTDGGPHHHHLSSVHPMSSAMAQIGRTCSSSSNVCRFCERAGSLDVPVIDNICPSRDCAELFRAACSRTLPCGHLCGGIKDEEVCLPCLHGCCCKEGGQPGAPVLRQDADDMCMICFTDALWPIPSIQLECGHVFHFACCVEILKKRWVGPRITFGFRNCPICKAKMGHPALRTEIDPIDSLYEDVKKKALMRLEYEGLSNCEAVTSRGSRFFGDAASYSIDRYAYYVCAKCGKAYYGGEAQCNADAMEGGAGGMANVGDNYNPEELVCGGCSDVSRAQICSKHGTDYLEYKCRYCCSVAVFFCFGTTHFCNACHDDFQRILNILKKDLPQCPVGPKALQLSGDECPLHVNHPPTGEEFALGCGLCRNAHTF